MLEVMSNGPILNRVVLMLESGKCVSVKESPLTISLGILK